jgi:hypothetical protein
MGLRGPKSRFDLMQPAILHERRPLTGPSSDRTPPDHLGEPERAIWTRVFADYALTSGLSVDILISALAGIPRMTPELA